jgi:hypothetical protein
LQYSKELTEAIDSINRKNKTKILQEVSKLEAEFDKFIEDNDYDSLLKIVPGKMIIGEVVIQLGVRSKEDYIEKVQTLVKTDSGFRNIIEAMIGIDGEYNV